jgi:5-methylcytosine-specific restriction endonuclease McrA
MTESIKQRHVAQYGSVKTERGYCEECKETAFIVDNRLQCCGAKVASIELDDLPTYQLSEPRKKRKVLKPAIKKLILEFQSGKCMYCGCKLSLTSGIKVHFDHVIPFINSNTSEHNIVATCDYCNLHKNDKMFDSITDIQIYMRSL